MRTTKAQLEEENGRLLQMIEEDQRRIETLEEQLEFYRVHSTVGRMTPVVVALERITEAVAHVLSDLKRR